MRRYVRIECVNKETEESIMEVNRLMEFEEFDDEDSY